MPMCGMHQHSLLIEEIDVGEDKPRTVVSGLAKFITPYELNVCLILLLLLLFFYIYCCYSPDLMKILITRM